MGVLAEQYRPLEVERAARELWSARGFPRPDGVVGRSSAPILHQFEGSLLSGDDPALVAFRAVAADVDARYFALVGRRALGTLRQVFGSSDEPAVTLLRDLSVWTGGAGGVPFDSADRRGTVEAILGRLASRGIVATRDTSLRICPSCAQARSPEGIVYQQEEGDTYLVRFPLPYREEVVHAIVWVDAPWRLLGASALLVSPHLPYVVARYRRRGLDEKILTSRPSLARLLEWLPGGEVEILEEHPGSHWQGQTYQYPLRHEFPMGGDLAPPSGTVLAVPDVGDSGTGIVPLVPGHGGTDALIADRLGISGWPLVTARGQLDVNLAHKYSGLDIPTASEFVARDLGESGALFARLRVRRGVPHCGFCGTAMVWAPGRAWCLEPSRLPPERRDLYRRLLPNDPPVGQVEVAAWPVSEPTTAPPGPFSVTLLECTNCERLDSVGGPVQCPCGSHRNSVTRRLLPSIAGTLGAWARFDPFPAGDSVWLYLNERRRTPALVHHLAAMSGISGVPSDVGLTVLPGIPEGGVPELVKTVGADAVRAALVGGEKRERSGPTFPDRCRQDARRLERWWYLARETLERCDPSQIAMFAQPITGSLGELETDDRAILARWERVRLAALADYDHQSAGTAYRRVANFLSNDLESYYARVRSRLDRAGTPPARRAALRTLHHLLRESAVVLAPVVPHVAEVVWGSLVAGRTSVFESGVDPLDSVLLDEEAIKAWDRWASVGRAVDAFRRRNGLAPNSLVPAVVAIVGSDELATQLRADRATMQRLGHLVRFEAFGPATPWTGRERSFEPILSEIQRVYPQEAGQILHLLKRMPARKRTEGVAPEELSVVVRGLSRKILPSMVEVVERLPDRIVAVPWNLGELYVELPAHRAVPLRTPPPGSPDAFRLFSRLERELRRTASDPPVERGPVLIATLDPLASELRAVARLLATYLGVSEVRVVDPSADFPRARCLFGRTRTGVHWWVRVPGNSTPSARAKHRVVRPPRARVRVYGTGGARGLGDVDYASEESVARSEQIRTLVQELDGILGAPLLGPTAVSGAWSAGLRSIDAFGSAPFEQISALPGFGRPIADVLVSKLGGAVPPRLPRRRSDGGSARADPAVDVNRPVESSGTSTPPTGLRAEPESPFVPMARPPRSAPRVVAVPSQVPARPEDGATHQPEIASPGPSESAPLPVPSNLPSKSPDLQPPEKSADSGLVADPTGESEAAPTSVEQSDPEAPALPTGSVVDARRPEGPSPSGSVPDAEGPYLRIEPDPGPLAGSSDSLSPDEGLAPEGAGDSVPRPSTNLESPEVAAERPAIPLDGGAPAKSLVEQPDARLDVGEMPGDAAEALAGPIPAGASESEVPPESNEVPTVDLVERGLSETMEPVLPNAPPEPGAGERLDAPPDPSGEPHSPPTVPEVLAPWGTSSGEFPDAIRLDETNPTSSAEAPPVEGPGETETLETETSSLHGSNAGHALQELPSSVAEPAPGDGTPSELVPNLLGSSPAEGDRGEPIPLAAGDIAPLPSEGGSAPTVPVGHPDPSPPDRSMAPVPQPLAIPDEPGLEISDLSSEQSDPIGTVAPEEGVSSPTPTATETSIGESPRPDSAVPSAPDPLPASDSTGDVVSPFPEGGLRSTAPPGAPPPESPELERPVPAGSPLTPTEGPTPAPSGSTEPEVAYAGPGSDPAPGSPPDFSSSSDPPIASPATAPPPYPATAPIEEPILPTPPSEDRSIPDSGTSPAADPSPTGAASGDAPSSGTVSALESAELGVSVGVVGTQSAPPLPVPEFPLPPPPSPAPSGGITLTVAPSYLPAFAHFLDATAAGHRGVCVVRESPDRLRAHVGPRPVEIYWLTNLGRGLTLRPSDLEGYGTFLSKSVEQDRVTAVFLEGVEYLARVHGAERVIEQLSRFQVVAQARNARVWVYLHPDLIPPADLALFETAFGTATD